MYDMGLLAPPGSTGNNTHDSYDVEGDYQSLAVQLVVEAVGASPTITFKAQGSADGSHWFDLGYITDASDTIATAPITYSSPTANTAKIIFVSNTTSRRYRFYRLVTSANTNVTYRAEIYRVHSG